MNGGNHLDFSRIERKSGKHDIDLYFVICYNSNRYMNFGGNYMDKREKQILKLRKAKEKPQVGSAFVFLFIMLTVVTLLMKLRQT